MPSSSDRAVRPWSWPGTPRYVLVQGTPLSHTQFLSPLKHINGTSEFNAEGNPAMD